MDNEDLNSNEDLITDDSNEELEDFGSNEDTSEEVQTQSQPEVQTGGNPQTRSNPLSNLKNGFNKAKEGSNSFKDVIAKNKNRTLNPSKNVDSKTNDSDKEGLEKKEGLGSNVKDKANDAAKEVVKKAASEVAKKYTGGLGGKAAEKLAGEAFDKLAKQNKYRMLLYLAPIIGTIVFFLLIIIIIVGASSENTLIKSRIYDYFEDETITITEEDYTLREYLIYEGTCFAGSMGGCEDLNEYRFYYDLRKVIVEVLKDYQKYNDDNCSNGSVLEYDYAFLVAAITYDTDPEQYFGVNVGYYEYTDTLDLYKEKIKALATNMLGGSPDTSAPTNGTTCYKLDADNLKDYIVKQDGYIDTYLIDEESPEEEVYDEEAKESIYNNILSEANSIKELEETGATDTINSTAQCPGVTVNNIDSNGIILSSKTYSLEDYVAGVISAEMYGDFEPETYKAFAIAVRTYTLSRTNYCTTSIRNSSRDQNFDENYKAFAVTATKATTGQILTYNGKIFSTEYDSWDCKGSNTCTYTKKPTGETHVITISDTYLSRAAGGHGRGMSQIAAADMALKGIDYKTILYSFYSDGVVISTMGGTTTVDMPTSENDLINRYYFTFDMETLYQNNVLFGQCVWYAKHRAMEIIASSNLSEEEKTTRIASVKATYGNGDSWYANMNGDLFTKNTNPNNIVAGSIISWDGGKTGYGHVAIVEKVYTKEDGTVMVVTSEGYRRGYGNCYDSDGDKTWCVVSADSLWSIAAVFSKVETLENLVNRSGYVFNGTVSLIG